MGISLLLMSGATTVEVRAQTAVVTVEENVRAGPNGVILGQVVPGTRVAAGGERGGWTQVTIGGFVFEPSLQVWTGGPLDLVVSAADGENLRDEPSGRIAGRMGNGTLLEEVRRIPGWIEVRRVAWMWSASLEMDSWSREAEVVAEAEPARQIAEPTGAPDAWLDSGPQGTPILASPGGDTMGQAHPHSDLRVLSEEGDWARVRVEGWVWVPGLSQEVEATEPGDRPDEPSSVSEVSADPERFEGQLVELDLQFISVERAERLRTDFYEGEPFLLTRSTDEGRPFVYVAVPPERLSQLQSLSPLQEIRVVGRVRSPAAAFTGNPILDLVEIERWP